MTRRDRMRRVAEGLAELADGNYAHRVILPGADVAARMAADLNALADRIQAERAEAVAADASRRQLLADISHDLRTPVTSIAGYIDALQRGLGDEPERYLGVLAQKAGELSRLTDDLFYSARLDAGDVSLTLEPLDLAEAVRRSVLGFEPQLAARDVRVELRIPATPCMVLADPGAVARVLSNLLANTLRHGTGMTRLSVLVETRLDDGGPHGGSAVCICNDGAGLPPESERLFERGETGSAGGAGLGLAIARRLAECMGGSLSVTACELGVAFELMLPQTPS